MVGSLLNPTDMQLVFVAKLKTQFIQHIFFQSSRVCNSNLHQQFFEGCSRRRSSSRLRDSMMVSTGSFSWPTQLRLLQPKMRVEVLHDKILWRPNKFKCLPSPSGILYSDKNDRILLAGTLTKSLKPCLFLKKNGLLQWLQSKYRKVCGYSIFRHTEVQQDLKEMWNKEVKPIICLGKWVCHGRFTHNIIKATHYHDEFWHVNLVWMPLPLYCSLQ